MLKLKFLKLHEDARLPQAHGQDSVGLDLCSVTYGKVLSEAVLFDTGLVLHPDSWPDVRMLQISLRSGFALKQSVVQVNAPGIVERSYTGFVNRYNELYGIAFALAKLNHKLNETTLVQCGDRIGQMLVYGSDGRLLMPSVDFETEWHCEAACSLGHWRKHYEGRSGFGSTGSH